MEETFCIGLDLSITGTGIVIMKPDFTVHHAIEIKKPKKYLNDTELFGLLSESIYRESTFYFSKEASVFCLIEQYAYSAVGQVTRLAELGGVVKNKLVYNANIPLNHMLHCAPGSLKKFVTGKGNVKKQQIMKEVYRKWGFDHSSDNVNDAYALARMMVHMVVKAPYENKYEEDAVKAVLTSKYNKEVVKHGYAIFQGEEKSNKKVKIKDSKNRKKPNNSGEHNSRNKTKLQLRKIKPS